MTTFRTILKILSLWLVLFALTASLPHAAEFSPELRAVMQKAGAAEKISIIVTLDKPSEVLALAGKHGRKNRTGLALALKERAHAAQAPIKKYLRSRGVSQIIDLWLINGLAFEASVQELESLRAMPGIEAVVLNESVYIEPTPLQEEIVAPGWNISRVGAPGLWALGYDGSGVVVAVLDSGADLDHPELSTRWRGTIDPSSISWFDPFGQFVLPQDSSLGHGTAVTGVIVAGEAPPESSIPGVATGVAPGSQWIAARIFDSAGNSSDAVIISGLQWALDPDGDPSTDDAADIVNCSWGLNVQDQCETVYQTAIRALKSAGIAVVAAAGNSGPATASESPANYPETIAVGATDEFDKITGFSARGPSACDNGIYPDVVAPGLFITTTDITEPPFPPAYVTTSGTSFSTSHVAGVMALLMQAFPEATVSEIEIAIKNSATDLGISGPDNIYGYGLVHALSAFDFLSGNIPDLDVNGPIPVSGGFSLDFGHVPPGTQSIRTATLRNSGSGTLHVGSIEATGLTEPFFLEETCSQVSLVNGETCFLNVAFAPTDFGYFEGAILLTTNDPDSEAAQLTIYLNGTGNTLPSPAQLLLPEAGAQIQGPEVFFAWTQNADVDGNILAHQLIVSPHSDFRDAEVFIIAVVPSGAAVLAGGSGLLGLLALWRRKRSWAIVFASGALVLLVSCDGGGGGGRTSIEDPLPEGAIVFKTSGFTSGILYYWKVVTTDVYGGTTQSAVRSFTVQLND